MKISCGVIITDGDNVLGCIPYGKSKEKNYLDIPKGGIKKGEKPIEAAIRECQEETGLELKESQLVYKGLFDYKPWKKLHLFMCEMSMPNISNLKCESFFYSYNKKVPEMIGWKIVPYKEIKKYFYQDLNKLICLNLHI